MPDHDQVVQGCRLSPFYYQIACEHTTILPPFLQVPVTLEILVSFVFASFRLPVSTVVTAGAMVVNIPFYYMAGSGSARLPALFPQK